MNTVLNIKDVVPEDVEIALKPQHAVPLKSILVTAKDIISSDLVGEVVILDLKTGVYYGLDAVGARVWTLIEESRSVGDIRDIIVSEYEVGPDRCEQDLLSLLEDLNARGLVEIRNGIVE